MLITDLNLPKSLQKGIDQMGYQTLTAIQQKSFPIILSGRDIIGIAQTGTGKTLAYLLPILKQYQFSNSDNPKIIIIVPTRELAVQIADEASKLSAFMSVRTLAIYGGVNINTQKKAIAEGVDLIVATPGRIMDLALDGIVRFDEVKKLVIDEFDEILNLGFKPQITSILAMMNNKRQNILFSATMTEEVDDIINLYFDFPEEVSLAPSGTPADKINQVRYIVPNYNTKINLLNHLLHDNTLERVLIFVNNKKRVDLVFENLNETFKNQFDIIHSNKTQNYRLGVIERFQQKEIRGIITTDIMARGLDLQDITHVINLEFPDNSEQYVHRIGRTGRAGKQGEAINIITPSEEETLIEVELLMNKEIAPLELPSAVVIATSLLEFEKKKRNEKNVKTIKPTGGGAFHEKKTKNQKINLGGPGKRNPRKTKPVNRGRLKKQTKK
ncbi:MAG: DEAD/DEAH box helicase [Bacteroidota bacterium]|nr:DEAD/DEAH box helicase [Bacteroidota bacterium]